MGNGHLGEGDKSQGNVMATRLHYTKGRPIKYFGCMANFAYSNETNTRSVSLRVDVGAGRTRRFVPSLLANLYGRCPCAA